MPYRIRFEEDRTGENEEQEIYFSSFDRAETMFHFLAKQDWTARVVFDERTGKTWGSYRIVDQEAK